MYLRGALYIQSVRTRKKPESFEYLKTKREIMREKILFIFGPIMRRLLIFVVKILICILITIETSRIHEISGASVRKSNMAAALLLFT